MALCLIFDGSGDSLVATLGRALGLRQELVLSPSSERQNTVLQGSAVQTPNSLGLPRPQLLAHHLRYSRYLNMGLAILFLGKSCVPSVPELLHLGGGRLKFSGSNRLNFALLLLSLSPAFWFQIQSSTEVQDNSQTELGGQSLTAENATTFNQVLQILSGGNGKEFWYDIPFWSLFILSL